ncbi:MAG TPA: 50S ribosomal protein L35 [Gemmataceae bacterium]|jgi:large subunit ribosomal protein L35|nr:50S ribosomal protein L35 [Gemmataceae bacterium]
MPKMKTHKGSKKRFHVTALGKLVRRQAGKKHLNSPKSAKRKRHLRSPVADDRRLSRKYIKIMGGEG